MYQFTKHEFITSPFQERANTSLQWTPSDTYEQFCKVKDKVQYGPDDISYDFNDKGFRCDNFDLWEKYPYRMVFAGCSFTEGIGLPLEDTWAKVFHKMICEKLGTNIPYWNIAKGGSGLDSISRALYVDCDMLKPQVVISYLPFLERRERWHRDLWAPGSISPETKLFIDERYVVYQTEKNLAFINLLLEKWNAIMLTMPVDYEFDFTKIPLSRIKFTEHYSTKARDLARDGMHSGPKANAEFAEELFKRFWPGIRYQFWVNRTG